MDISPHRMLHGMSRLLAVISLAGIVGLLAWDIRAPQHFPANSHAVLGAFPLATIGLAWLTRQAVRSATRRDWLKAALLAAAFFFWAANQCLRNAHSATICNDIAIALFVLDLVIVIAA